MIPIKNNLEKILYCYENMYSIREIDKIENELVKSGKAHFLASCKGHEGSALFAQFLTSNDWLHCHYRDKSIMHARGIDAKMFFYSALCKAESVSHGRQMVIGLSERKLNIVSVVTPVGNQALPSVGIAQSIKYDKGQPIVYCSMGDGTTQQGEVMEALAESKRSNLPILFVIQNNNYAISTFTKDKTFFSLPKNNKAKQFYDIPITYIDGSKPFENCYIIENTIKKMRLNRSPQIIIFQVERLESHSNADNHQLYRSEEEILTIKKNKDPILLTRNFLIDNGIKDVVLKTLEKKINKIINEALKIALQGTKPKAYFKAERDIPEKLLPISHEYRGNFNTKIRITMANGMREVFYNKLLHDNRVYLFGEDIEDKKGDIFGITKGLSTKFPGRVINSPLSESTILGVSIGMALTGKKPVAFIQFADFMAHAYNLLFNEMATMFWRSNGDWDCPVIIFAACGGYRAGLGPFHAQTNESIFAHIPGIDVFMPSNASDAVGLLNAAFDSNRPSIFLYPKNLLNNHRIKDTTSSDIHKQIIPISKARVIKYGSDLTLVGWGNTIDLCEQVANTLEEQIGIETEIIDLRTIKPYDLNSILLSVEKTRRLIVTHEDNLTCGLAGEIIAAIIEKSDKHIKVKRITRDDTYVPCNFENQIEILPSYEKLLTAAAKLLNLSLTWERKNDHHTAAGYYDVEIIAPSPTDDSVLITDIFVQVGDIIKVGTKLVTLEASKSNSEILSPKDGLIEKISVKKFQRYAIGKKLLTLRLFNDISEKKISKSPILYKKNILNHHNHSKNNKLTFTVGISIPTFKTGSRKVLNNELLKPFPNHISQDIINRTGIESRFWLDKHETIVDIAADTVKQVLRENNLSLNNINMIICSTCTPEKYLSPSMSCIILEKLYKIYGKVKNISAYDINAACSGYLYALQNAYNYLQTRPNEIVLVISAEYMSKYLNSNDFDTIFLFGDAATSTIVYGGNYKAKSKAFIEDILLNTIAENEDHLNIPLNSFIQLQGQKVFNYAVKAMSMMMSKCCHKTNLSLNDIDTIIPHQANKRILNAIEKRLNLNQGRLYSNILRYGNTSSSSIPIALNENLNKYIPINQENKILLCAFGSGFTSAAAILNTTDVS